MSRSRKKPYISTTCMGARAGVQKKWKTQCNRKLRRLSIEEVPDKRLLDNWTAPNDGKAYWDEPKFRRK